LTTQGRAVVLQGLQSLPSRMKEVLGCGPAIPGEPSRLGVSLELRQLILASMDLGQQGSPSLFAACANRLRPAICWQRFGLPHGDQSPISPGPVYSAEPRGCVHF
jgi:hypothetical protein